MTDKYRLVHYSFRGAAEPIRYMFAIAGVPYEDERIPWDWDMLDKPYPVPAEWLDRIPYGKLPMLEINDGEKRIVSAKPICRYLASKFDMLTGNDFDDSKCDEYMDTLADFTGLARPIFRCRDPVARAPMIEKFQKGPAQKYLRQFEQIVRANNGRNLVGDKLTWADIYLAHVIDNFNQVFDLDLLQDYPSLATLVHSVLTIPAVQEWIDRRPNSIF